MLRTLLFAAALAVASSQASAHGDDFIRGNVISVVPHLSLSFGSMRHDGFNVTYESGGRRFNTFSDRHPGRLIMVPPPFVVMPVVPHPYYRSGHWRNDDRRGWRDHDRGDNRRHWRDDRRGNGRHHGHND